MDVGDNNMDVGDNSPYRADLHYLGLPCSDLIQYGTIAMSTVAFVMTMFFTVAIWAVPYPIMRDAVSTSGFYSSMHQTLLICSRDCPLRYYSMPGKRQIARVKAMLGRNLRLCSLSLDKICQTVSLLAAFGSIAHLNTKSS